MDFLHDTFLTCYGVQLRTGIDVLLISLALGHRYNIIKEENKKIMVFKNEIEIAHTIYESIVQTEIPTVKELAIETFYLTTELIGGDILEIHFAEDGTDGFFISDISG